MNLTGVSKKVEGIVAEIKRYADAYYQVRGYYPSRITVTKDQHRSLSGACPVGRPNLTYRGVPIKALR